MPNQNKEYINIFLSYAQRYISFKNNQQQHTVVWIILRTKH